MNAVLRATTERPETLLRSVMMSSVMPSLKYSCSASPLMLLNGRTTIEGLVAAARMGSLTGGTAPDTDVAGGRVVVDRSGDSRRRTRSTNAGGASPAGRRVHCTR